MGHPLGCSGARILCTLLSVLIDEKATFGACGICNGKKVSSSVSILYSPALFFPNQVEVVQVRWLLNDCDDFDEIE
jgi:hypothetical protein